MKSVLITGGAGSLGKAFVRLLQKDYQVAVVDNNEWALASLRSEFPDVACVLDDFANYVGWHDYVIHCAAYKHVDLGEENAASFVDTNVTKYQRFLANQQTDKLLFISTDKAVEPVSLYGMTKAIGEKLTREWGGSVARLGNVLNSNGSVIPVWEQAIANKEPVKVTDERMVRYLIEDYDAANQIWHEFIKGETLIVPKMGEPVRLMDILTQVLERHGYLRPQDYEPGIEIIGLRPGEKLAEKLWWDDESHTVTTTDAPEVGLEDVLPGQTGELLVEGLK